MQVNPALVYSYRSIIGAGIETAPTQHPEVAAHAAPAEHLEATARTAPAQQPEAGPRTAPAQHPVPSTLQYNVTNWQHGQEARQSISRRCAKPFTLIWDMLPAQAGLYMTQSQPEGDLAVQEYRSEYLDAAGPSKFKRNVEPLTQEVPKSELLVVQKKDWDLMLGGLRVSVTNEEACSLAELEHVVREATKEGEPDAMDAANAALSAYQDLCKENLHMAVQEAEDSCRWGVVEGGLDTLLARNVTKVEAIWQVRDGSVGELKSRICDKGNEVVDGVTGRDVGTLTKSFFKTFIDKMHGREQATRRRGAVQVAFEASSPNNVLVGVGRAYKIILTSVLGLKTVGDIAALTDAEIFTLQERVRTENLATNRLNLWKLREQAHRLLEIGVPEEDDAEESDDDDGHRLQETEEHIYAENTEHDEEAPDPELVEA